MGRLHQLVRLTVKFQPGLAREFHLGIEQQPLPLLDIGNFPEIKAIHLRKTGSRGGELRGCFEAGRIAHHMGYHPIFIIVRSIHRMLSGPFIVGGFAMLFGFFKNWISGSPIFEEGETVRYLRRKQLKRLGLTREK